MRAFLCALVVVAGCDDAKILPDEDASVGMDAAGPDAGEGDGPGAACDVEDNCADDLVCGRMWAGGARLACMRECSEPSDCPSNRCVVEIETSKYCSIPCDPIEPFADCPSGTVCQFGEAAGGVWATSCADWPTGVAPQNTPCGPSAGGKGCAAGHTCYTIDGGMNWRCTAVCETISHRGCPAMFSCSGPGGVSEGITYGFCYPPGGVWPDPA